MPGQEKDIRRPSLAAREGIEYTVYVIIVDGWVRETLLREPEYGMGYQKTRITVNSRETLVGFVFNAAVFLRLEEVLEVRQQSETSILQEASRSSLRIEAITVIPRSAQSLRGVRRVALRTIKVASAAERLQLEAKIQSGAAKDAPITLTEKGDVFKRFSAYKNDRRITEKWGLTQGTFGTTKEDADANIRTGSDAVSRYALENKMPASNVLPLLLQATHPFNEVS